MATVSIPSSEILTIQRSVSSTRLGFLDAVRGLAALLVVIYHCCQSSSNVFSTWSLQHFDLGQVGVASFFLVSGFVIPFSLERHGSLLYFWKGRLLRLFPLYWITLLAALLLAAGHLYILPSHPHHSLISITLVNATMFQDFLRTPTISPVYWTLPLEMIFYVCCSLAFWRGTLKRSVTIFLAALGLMLAADLVGQFYLHHSMATARMVLIVTSLFGTLAYRLYQGRIKLRWVYALSVPFILVVTHGFWFRTTLPAAENAGGGMSLASALLSWLAGGCIFFIAFIYRSRTVYEVFLYLGRISYSLYLIHPLVVEALPHSWNLLFSLPAVIVISCGIAHFSYRLIEAPLMRIHAGQRPN